MYGKNPFCFFVILAIFGVKLQSLCVIALILELIACETAKNLIFLGFLVVLVNLLIIYGLVFLVRFGIVV